MNAIEHILAHPDDFDPQTETLPCGATLRIWRGSKLVSAHGARPERSLVPTGGLTFEVTFPAPSYGPARPLISRLRADKGWDANDARSRYAYILRQAAHTAAINELRDFLHEQFLTAPQDKLIDLAFAHNLLLDVEDLSVEQINHWISLLSQQHDTNEDDTDDTY